MAALWFIGLQILCLETLLSLCVVVRPLGIILAATMLHSKFCAAGMKLGSADKAYWNCSLGWYQIHPKADQFEIVHYDPVSVDAVPVGDEGLDAFALQAKPLNREVMCWKLRVKHSRLPAKFANRP